MYFVFFANFHNSSLKLRVNFRDIDRILKKIQKKATDFPLLPQTQSHSLIPALQYNACCTLSWPSSSIAWGSHRSSNLLPPLIALSQPLTLSGTLANLGAAYTRATSRLMVNPPLFLLPEIQSHPHAPPPVSSPAV